MSIKILLVEDEPHKRDELTECVESFFQGRAALTNVDSVNAAFWEVSVNDFDLILLDMALPTFSTEGSPTERGQDQALGGVEVLRALKSRGVTSKIIIITQYPDVAVGGKRVKLASAAEVLSKRYDQNVIGGVLYRYKSMSNSTKLIQLLRSIS